MGTIELSAGNFKRTLAECDLGLVDFWAVGSWQVVDDRHHQQRRMQRWLRQVVVDSDEIGRPLR